MQEIQESLPAILSFINDLKQSQELIAEMRILTEMKMENRGWKYFPWPKNREAYIFSVKMMDLLT